MSNRIINHVLSFIGSTLMALWAVVSFLALPTNGFAAINYPAGSVPDSNYATLVASNNTQGWEFTVNQPLSITALGVFDMNNTLSVNTGDGLLFPHHVTLYMSTGGVVAEATVPVGTAGTLVGDFRYTSISPVTLSIGNYVIGASYGHIGSQGDPDYIAADFFNGFIAAPIITITGGRFSTSGDVFPASNESIETFGPSMLITDIESIPEVSTVGLGLFAALLGAGSRFRNRRAMA